MVKIAFFDVDGTLLDYGKKEASASTLKALKALQQKGIKIVISSGRAPFALPSFKGIQFDALICYTGAIVQVGDQIIFEKTIPTAEAQKLANQVKALGKPICFSAKDHLFANFFDSTLEAYLQIAHQHCPVVSDFEEQLNHSIYQGMIPLPMERKAEILAGIQESEITGWWPNACDVIPKGNSKGIGVQKILEYFQIDKEEAIAFGDGDNDMEMMKEVGLRVAMENGSTALKEKADFITHSVCTDGIEYALKHFHIL